MMVACGVAVAANLAPAPRFSAREGRLRSLVHVLVFVELELERHLHATRACRGFDATRATFSVNSMRERERLHVQYN